MIQYIDTKIKRLFSRTFGRPGTCRGGMFAARQLRIESLEPRQLLDAASWTAVDVADEAAAFFDDSYVHDIYITFDDADWYNTLYDSHANDPDDPYFAADFSADGVVIEDVGVRFKGNSSFSGSSVKKSLKIDFDEFDEDNDELNFHGLKKLNLNNNFNDPTQMREKLFLDYASNFVEGVGRAVHTNVYINDELWGFYTAIEQIDKTFVQSRFGSDEDGNLYKGAASDDASDPQADFGSDLTYLGSDPEPYYDYYQLKTNETANDYTQLIEFIDVLNNTSTEDFPSALEPLLDVQDTLAGMAINNLFSNLDSYSGSAHNYYLYDRDDTGQFSHIFWDVNETFGTFAQFTSPGQDMAELEPFWLPEAMGPPGQDPEERPLMENLWAVDEYSEDYLRDLAEMLREGFDVTSASARIDSLAGMIRSDVYADPNKQYTSSQFETNLDNNVYDGMRTIYGLTSFIEDRSDYLNDALDSYATTSDLVLNELMSVNVATVQDESGDYDPWVEIYNFGPGLVDLSGLYLTDDTGDLTKWALPSGDLDDGEFLTLWIDGETGEGSNHASFSLSAAGGELHLSDGVTLIDTVTYDAMAGDLSLARVPDGDGDWESTDQPTPGAANLASLVVIEPVVLYVNEFMADNDSFIEDPDEPGAYNDWIELYNPGTEAVDLSGMYLTDDLSNPVEWQIPDGITIDAGGYLIVWADNDTEQGDTHASFKLSADGEEIGLYHIDGTTLIDSVEFGAQTTDVSYGRYPDGSESWDFMSISTPGEANTAVGDFDSDGDVDGEDLVVWEGGFGTATGANYDDGDTDSDGDVDGIDFLDWQRNFTGAASSVAAASSSDDLEETDTGSAFFSTIDAVVGSSNSAASDPLDSTLTQSTDQDTPTLPSVPPSLSFDSVDFADRSLPWSMLGASDNTSAGGNLPRRQTPQQQVAFQHQPVQRDMAVDIVMSRPDLTNLRVDLSRLRETATDTTDATVSDEFDDIARPRIRGVGKGRQEIRVTDHVDIDVALEELWGTA